MDGDQGRTLANFMGMAATAERAQNNEEAISYYNRVLEVDPTYSEAWLGKGRAAGWLSSLANLRVTEAIVAFGNAIGSAGEDAKPAIAERANADLTAIATALYATAVRHYRDHKAVAGVVNAYVKVSAVLIDALVTAQPWNPANRATLDQTVEIARQLLDRGVNPELAAVLRVQMADANARIAAIDPSYQRPATAEVTQAQKDQLKAEWDTIGLCVAVGIVVLVAIVAAVTRG